MSTASVLINLAYVALLGSAFTRTLTWLRILLTLGSGLFVIYGIIEDIPSIIVWNTIIGLFHGMHVLRDERARRAVRLTDEEAAIRDELFGDLDDFDFNVVWSLGDPLEVTDDVLVDEGSHPDDVTVVLDGAVRISRGGDEIARLERGALVGEMSFVSGEAARASAIADGRVQLHRWDQRDLATLAQLNPAGARAFDALVSRDLAAKAG